MENTVWAAISLHAKSQLSLSAAGPAPDLETYVVDGQGPA